MDPIDRIAVVFESDCVRALKMFSEIKHILDTSETLLAAHHRLRREGFAEHVDMEHIDLVAFELGRYGRCLELLDEAKALSRRIFVVSFHGDSDPRRRVLHKEICFSYACKMLASVGPSLGHFSGKPTSKEVVGLELRLACETPFLALQAYSDLLCLESMSCEADACVLGLDDAAERENLVLEDLRRSARRVSLTSCEAKRRRLSAEASSSPLLRPKANPAALLSPEACSLLCDESLTPPTL